MRKIDCRLAAGSLCLGLAACGGSSSSPSLPPVDPSGDWQSTMTETDDPCNLNSPAVEVSATRITRSGSNILLQADYEACDPGVATYDPSIMAYRFQYNGSSQFVAADNCTYNESRAVDLVITATLISGSDSLYYTRVSGTSCTYLPQNGCGVSIQVVGQKCQGCYNGCIGTAGSLPRADRGPGGGPMPGRYP